MNHLLASALRHAAVLALLLASTPLRSEPDRTWVSAQGAQYTPESQYIFVHGKVAAISEPLPDATPIYTIFLTDATGALRVDVLADTYREMVASTPLAKGDFVEIYGRTTRAGEETRLVLDKANALRVAEKSTSITRTANGGGPQLLSAGAIGLDQVGGELRVRGTVIQFRRGVGDGAYHRLTIEDPSGTVEVIYPASLQSAFSPTERPKVGMEIEVTGIVRHDGEGFQVRAGTAQQLRRIDLGAPSAGSVAQGATGGDEVAESKPQSNETKPK